MINDNENEAENDRPRLRYERRCTKCKICLSVMMVIYIKQHRSNISRSIHEKVKQHWG